MELSIFIASNAQLLSPRNTLFHCWSCRPLQ